MSGEAASAFPENVRRAVDKLKLLHASDLCVDEAIACGRQAIPALCELLFEREPSGLYQVRRRAVEALAGLGAHDVLMDFLRVPHEADDPVERLGDEAVVNAAALALSAVREEHVFQLLLALVRRRDLPGVVAALGSYDRPEAIPVLIDALAADDCRQAAEAALARLGPPAHPALLKAASLPLPPAERESVSSIRRRRSALGLLRDAAMSPETWPVLRQLMKDADARIAVLACNLGLAGALTPDRKDAVRRLIGLLSEADWMLTREIEDCLVTHFDQANDIIAAAIRDANDATQERATRALLRARQRAQAISKSEDNFGI
jgi:HEAT repeat protein